MLKKFFLNTLSSFMGAWIALVIFGIVVVIVITGLVAKIGFNNSVRVNVTEGSVLVIDINGPIQERERPFEPSLDIFTGQEEKSQTLLTLKEALAAAKENKNIAAVYLKCGMVSASPATLNALRDAIIDFKQSGKPVFAYADSYSMGSYYVATVADKVFLNPGGTVSLQGIGGTVLYYKNLLDKIGVNIQVIKVGTYKSAVEPYILPEMSQPARAQLDTLYNSIWSIIRNSIAQQRDFKNTSYIDTLINRDFIAIRDAKVDLSEKLVDALYYERSIDSVIAANLHRDKDKLNFVNPQSLVSEELVNGININSKNQIAVLYAVGDIVDGGGPGMIDYQILVPTIIQLAEDDNIKGMVLRVNSPGGAVFGSMQIGEALDYFQSKGKTLAVSMGDYAASGGYWISACANRIFANPLTITGSIGIFGLIPDIEPLLDKVGVSPQMVSTNPEAAFPTLLQPMNNRQHAAMQSMIEEGYDKFISRVARGRHMTKERVKQIGEGRVWSAEKAKEIGLIDEFGSLDDAVKWVAQQENITNYDISYFPLYQNTLWSFVYQLGSSKFNERMKNILGNEYSYKLAEKIYFIINCKGAQAKMPEMHIRFADDIKISYF